MQKKKDSILLPQSSTEEIYHSPHCKKAFEEGINSKTILSHQPTTLHSLQRLLNKRIQLQARWSDHCNEKRELEKRNKRTDLDKCETRDRKNWLNLLNTEQIRIHQHWHLRERKLTNKKTEWSTLRRRE